ncbi:MAG: hypothetical protein LBC67_00605 [Spirochaetales bacterium]|nr:hypothetical protein [Spirochaetales bacterium]
MERIAPLKNAIRATTTQCRYDALSLIVRIAKIRVLSDSHFLPSAKNARMRPNSSLHFLFAVDEGGGISV